MPLDEVAPQAAPRPVTTEHHGRTRVDPYDWLRDLSDPATMAYLDSENVYAQQRTSHLAALREQLFEETKARTLETDLSVPVRNRGWWWYSRSFEGQQYSVSCRAPVLDDTDWTPPTPDPEAGLGVPALPGEEILLDLNALAQGHDFFALGGASASLDDRFLAWSTDTTGDERYTVRVKRLSDQVETGDVLTGVLGGVTWHPDSTRFYYSTVDQAWRPDKVWCHVLGTDQSADELVYEETDPKFFTGVGRSRDNRFLMIASGSKTTSEVRFLDTEAASDSDADHWQLFAARREGLEYSLEPATIGGAARFLVLHNLTGPDFEISTAPVAPAEPEAWQSLIPFDSSVRLEGVDAFASHLLIHQRSSGLTQLRVVELTDVGIGDDYLIAFDSPIYTVGAAGNPDVWQRHVRLGFATMVTPASVYEYDLDTRQLRLLKQTPVLGGFDTADYSEERVWVTAEDGAQIPVSLCYRRSARTGQPQPLLLYGYGSYEASIDPYFSIPRLSLLDRGAVFAIAHVRGGGELGRAWYDHGKLDHKRNTFTDFVACARHLAATGWTSPDLIVAEGGSAGGLLMGAVANLAPDAFGAIVADVPFVDNLTTMLDASLPLTVTEYDEWGNPEADPAAYDYIASYAPYDNVATRDYPPILATTSLSDTRVLYVEPAKWIARLRAANPTGDFLLKTEMSAGHGGVSGRYDAWRDRAWTLAWILDRMGLAA